MEARVSRIYWARLLLLSTLCLLSSASGGGGAATAATVRRRQLEIRRLLNKLNKPAVKSIKSPDGDIIDCVYVSHQPAFDHPLLRNHTIQMRPSFYPESQFDEINLSLMFNNSNHHKQSSKQISQLWHKNGRCPKNTIPIRRTMEEDILRATSVKSYGRKKRRTVPFPSSSNPHIKKSDPHREYAIISVNGDKYYGALATMNLWNPHIQHNNEMSVSQLWIGSGEDEEHNTIEAGWQVYPRLYGDSETRLFIYWTKDAYNKTGCYNLRCPGFIQLNGKIALGSSLSPTSYYNGYQYEISILIWKDPLDGNWWMLYQGQHIGYWPSDLFTHLADSASSIDWGGEVAYKQVNGDHTSTQMGSGHFAEEGLHKACYLRNIQIVDSSNTLSFPQQISTDTDRPSCYNLHNDQNKNSPDKYFYFGGPGKNPNCP